MLPFFVFEIFASALRYILFRFKKLNKTLRDLGLVTYNYFFLTGFGTARAGIGDVGDGDDEWLRAWKAGIHVFCESEGAVMGYGFF